MGFRGEAVPSIASVSRFTLTTRERRETGSDAPAEAAGDAAPGAAEAAGAAPATQIVINGGKILEVKEAGAPPGTTVEVRSLFFNVPARRKFLRGDDTERAHIQHWLTTAALAHPQTGFQLTLENRTVWQLPPLPVTDSTGSRLQALHERLRLLVGDGLALAPVDVEGQLESVRVAPADVHGVAEISPPARARIWGWIGAPGVSRGTREDQYLFVNRRPVENRGLNAALLEGYHNTLMKGRYPLCCLFLELDPAEVDVNIHPAKREVKFHRERAVRRFVAEAVREALQAWHQPVGEGTQGERRGARDEGPGTRRETAAQVAAGFRLEPPAAPVPEPPPHPDLPGFRPIPPPWANRPAAAPLDHGPDVPVSGSSPSSSPAPIPPEAPAPAPASAPSSLVPRPPSLPAPPAPGPVPLLSIPLRIVGVIGRLYVVLESDRGLVLLDQHAAHERVLYEQMLRRVQEGGTAPAQRLLLPETIEVSPKDAAFLRENLEVLTRLGVGLSVFGERTFLLDALPPFVKSAQPRRFALELVDELRAAGATVNAWRLGESVVAKTVCRHSVKANDPLAGPELEALLESLRGCDMPYTCPHGRPTLIEMSYRELEKKFGRVTG
jgi:DNA mismatch repair protein MutL